MGEVEVLGGVESLIINRMKQGSTRVDGVF